MKTTVETNWRVEICAHNEASARHIAALQSGILKHRIKVRCDRKEICDRCGRPWTFVPRYHEESRRTLLHCCYCNAPERDEQ